MTIFNSYTISYMARLTNNKFPLRGQISKQLVFKQYGDKTIVTKYPDMQGIKPSVLQKEQRHLFKEAVAYAKAICANALLKESYQQRLPKGKSVYHFAIQEYLQQQKT